VTCIPRRGVLALPGTEPWLPREGVRRLGGLLAIGLLLLANSCRKAEVSTGKLEIPDGAVVRDHRFHSEALGREVTYRVIAPAHFVAGQRLRFVYLLHGNGANYREWSESSKIAELATDGYVLVMPEGRSSFYVNSASEAKDKYEDFITGDLVRDAESEMPAPVRRGDRAILGVSMGGFAAVNLSFKHPDLYGFAGGLSPAVDVPQRPFSFRRLPKSLSFRSIFGPSGSTTRVSNNPYLIAKQADPAGLPFLFLTVGRDESLREPVERFAAEMRSRGIAHEFQELPGGHDWRQWNAQLPVMLKAMQAKMASE
jgi:putative tributyrin esterase